MSFLDLAKSTFSKALGPQQPTLLFTIGPVLANQDSDSIWVLHSGIKKDDTQAVTVFIFDCKRNPDKIALARNALRRAKTIRYPGCLKFIDGTETESQIIIGTEYVTHLNLQNPIDQNLIRLGLFKIATTLKFLCMDSGFIHGFISSKSIFVTRSGEWKLGGFELISSTKEDQSTLLTYGYLLKTRHVPPEMAQSSSNTLEYLKNNPAHSYDAWGYGCLIYTIFNGEFSNSADLEVRGKIPTQLFRYFKSFINQQPKSRLDFSKFLENNNYFNNEFITSSQFLENFALKDKQEKEQFLSTIESTVEKFPIEFCKFKILPELIQSLEFGGAGAKALKPILTIGGRLDQDEFSKLVTPAIIKLFASSDRSIRLALCEKMDLYLNHLSDQMSAGFLDTMPIIREQTLKAVALIAPKLNSKTINNSLLRMLAKLQTDQEPGIRTNTTICLVKLSKYFDDSVKSKVLLQAFLRSLHDPFPFARKAGLMGITATSPTKKILPHICPLFIDPETSIREQALSTLDTLIAILKSASYKQPDVVDPVGSEPGQPKSTTEAGWASWAMSAVSNTVSGSLKESKPPLSTSSSVSNLEILANKPATPEPLNSSSALESHKRSTSGFSSGNTVTSTKPAAEEENGWGDEWDADPEINESSNWNSSPIKAKPPSSATSPKRAGLPLKAVASTSTFKKPLNPSISSKVSKPVASSGWDDWDEPVVETTNSTVESKSGWDNDNWDSQGGSDSWGTSTEPVGTTNQTKSRLDREKERQRRKEAREARRTNSHDTQ
ncbi:hypothetical protein HDV02_003591 [Globomyces sp. JEL0801]|nr:hypothetical protein HDV02_003591 [Globomyces sp. JEL0801]